ncbi:MAG: gliding motility-associated C-terminal domain-containing protein [Bacteroidia bacterium]|nr:gliding motility-associated C-terminal domain-containing protein [Bacteroidia bacterium]
MVRYLGIVFCILLVKTLHSQCPNSQIMDYDCSTGTLSYSLVVSGPAPYSFTTIPVYPFTVTGNTLVMSFSTTANILINYLNGSNCFNNANPVVNAATFNSFFAISTLSPFTNSITCFGNNDGAISLTVTGSSVVLPVTYTVNGSAIAGSTLTNLSPGIYTVIASGADGCKRTETISINEPSDLNTSCTNSISCFGGTVNAVLTTTGGVGSKSYSVNGSPIASNTLMSATAGTYTIITKDINNCTKTNIITINQPIAPVLNFNITQPSCPTSSNGGLTVNVLNMQAPFSYTWTAPTNTNSFLTNIPKGIYTLTVRDASNCKFTNTVSVIPISNIQTTFITKPETCSAVDAAVTVNVTGGSLPLTYSISPFPSQSANTFSNLSTGIYSVIVTDANTCSLVSTFSIGNTSSVLLSITSQTDILCYNNCDGKLIMNVVNAIAPVTFSLTNLPTYTTSNINNICAGTYTIKVIDNIGCYAVTTATFTNPAPYSFSVNGTSQICVSKSATLIGQANGGTAPYTFSWMPGGASAPNIVVSPSATTVFSLNVFDVKGCTLAPETFTVNVKAPITVSISAQNAGICPGTTAQITPSVTGGDGNYTYLWLPGNITTPSIFLASLTNPSYTYIVSDACGSPTSTTVINLQIFPVTVPTFSTDTAIGCQPLCVQFKNTTPTSINHYWNFGDMPFEQNVQDPFYCYTRSGKFNIKLSLTDINGCKVSATYSNYINVLQQPKPNFITKPEILTDDMGEGTLLNSTTNGTSFKWFVDDVYKGNSTNLNISFNDTVCYIIKLIADNSNGCKDSTAKLICIKPGFTFYMPNTITPNDDGLNDVLLPFGRSWVSDNYKFRVFNRWGQLIFQTKDIAEGWNGKLKGSLGLNDTYVWTVAVTDYYGNEHSYHGTVVLLK